MYSTTRSRRSRGLRRSILWLTSSLIFVGLLSGGRFISRAFNPWSLGNYANTAIPLGGNTTVTPDAAPVSTTSISVSSSTNFKGKLVGDPTTGVIRVTDAHPAGIYTVTITAFDGGPSTRTFTLTVTTPATCNPVSFAPASLVAGSQPGAAAIGDFDGDGKQDLAVANRNSNNVSILLGNGDGTFAANSNYLADTAPNAVVVGDFNGDGIQDLAIANNTSNNVSVLLGGGGGGFSVPANFNVGAGPFSIAVGDFNGDGRQDLATANNLAASVSVLLGNGAGSFSSATNFNVGSSPESVAVGDFNGDSKQDLVAANASSNNVSVLLGNGVGGFAAATNFNVGSLPFSVAVGDFNGDGKQDLASANRNSDNVSVLLGNGAGSFSAATDFGAGTGAISVAVADLNGDGKLDIVTANTNSADASVLLGNGAGSFAAPLNFSLGAGSGPSSIAVGDFNGDGKQDLVSANTSSNDVTVLLRQCLATFSISGKVTDDSANGISSAQVTLSGSASDSAFTDVNGNYSFPSVAVGGNYTVTPSSTSYVFSPVNQTFNNLNVARIANFVGTQTLVSISGKVTDAGTNPINSVTVQLIKNGAAAGTAQTNLGGNYFFVNQTTGANYVVMPVGRFSPSALTFNSLTTNAVANFKATPAIPLQCSTVSFAAAANFNVGLSPRGVTVGDFDGDAKLDVVAANQTPTNGISLLLGTGAGAFIGPANFNAGNGPVSVAVGDFNTDGKLDLVTAKFAASNVSLLAGNGAGSFAAATNFAAGSNPDSVAVGDFNADGKLDMALANAGSGNVSVLLGNGAGSFAAATNFAVGPNPVSVAVGDFNGDGKLDLAVANQGSDNVSVLLGNGAGSFAAATNFAAGSVPTAVAVGDLNSDGKPDLAVSNDSDNNVSVLLGNGLGGFGAATNFAVPPSSNPGSVVLGDFNGDGKLDMATENNNSGKVSVFLGDGSGSFNAATNFNVGSVPTALAVGDFNGDGKSDLVVTNQNNNNVSVLINNGATCGTQTSLDISGQVVDALQIPLPNVTVTLSGTITRVVQTDSLGKYSFTGLTPGGNYSVTLQSNYFMFAASRADFFNLGGNQTPNFLSLPVVVPAPTPPLSDNFNSPLRDASKWNLGTLTLPSSAVDPRVGTAQVNGQLLITPLAQTSGLHYNGYVSANSFDLRNGKASVELVKAASGGADTIFGVGSDSDNYCRFVVHTPGVATSLTQTHPGNSKNGVAGPLDAAAGLLIFQVRINGQLTSLSINYDPVQHRFMRFRLEPLTNSIVFETSPDDINYTVQHSVVLQKGASALTAELTAGTANPANPGAAIFDNFGLVTSTFQFSTGAYAVAESAGLFSVTVTRSGATTNAASVDFATADGTAQQRTRYINTAGRLAFAAGEVSKTFDVLIEDNAQAEGSQTVNLLLLNPVGSGLNSPGRALLNITDNDSIVATGNPLDDPRFFVQQNYFDFLSRFPDQGGSDFWTSVITGPPACAQGDLPCVSERRITVSNAFFFELEFQQTGAYVFRIYRAAFGNTQPFPNPDANPQFPGQNLKLPSYEVFAHDRAQVVGGSSLSQSQLDLANAFVQRPEFLAKYPANLAGPAFVDAILATIMNDLGVNLSSQRSALITLFNQAGQGGRGGVLYRLADDNTQTNPINNRPLIDAEYIRSFVATQYFGYLRRDADIGGFLFWLGQVNSAPLRDLSKQRAMVCSFITSAEYQQRFSAIVTHDNQECR